MTAFAGIRQQLNRHRKMTLIVIYCFLGALVIFNSRGRLKRLVTREPEAAARYERFPVEGKFEAYETFQIVEPLAGKRMSFEVPLEEKSGIEVGLIRKTDTSHYYEPFSGNYRFRVYLQDGFSKKVLVDATGQFPTNKRRSFKIDSSSLGKETQPRKIVYEIDKERSDEAKGYEPYRDFAFVVPTVYKERGPDDPNVVIVTFDTLRADHMGCYGYKRDTTPNLDAFAEKGVLFSQAISQCPWTTPSYYSLFTSLYPSAHQNKMESKKRQIYYLRETPMDTLRQAGYYTIAFTNGACISSEFGFGKGFNIYTELTEMTLEKRSSSGSEWATVNDSEKIFNEAMAWLQENADKQFFMFIHTLECHDAYVHKDFLSEDGVETLIDKRKALYDGDIRYADKQFGRLIDKLRSMDLLSNTVIIFLSDHGEDFYDHYREADILPPNTEPIHPEISIVDHGHSLYEEVVHVPLIFYIPGLEPARGIITNQVRLIDVMPTILDYLNISYKGPVQGTSLLRLIATGEREVDPPAISEFTGFGPERKALRMNGYKYIWIEDPNTYYRHTFRNLAQNELFDLKTDPGEHVNLYDKDRPLGDEYHKILEKDVQDSLDLGKAYREELDQPPGKGEDIDKDVLDNLKALGYLK